MTSKFARRGTLSLHNYLVSYLFQTAKLHVIQNRHPIVLIGGTAQTINSLLGHHAPLANMSGRGLLQYELRGQGTTTTLPLDDCSLARHVEDFDAVLSAHSDFTNDGKVDLCGFSFGGRVALAIAAERPDRVRKIVCTGVPADRGATGRIILRTWLDTLARGDLEAFVWQSMTDGHSQSFLNRHESRLRGWVKAAVESNRAEAIAGLVGQTHTDDLSNPWHTVNLAKKAADNGLLGTDALFLVGDQDRIAPPEQCRALANEGGWKFDVIKGAGHSVPIEQPILWREALKRHFEV